MPELNKDIKLWMAGDGKEPIQFFALKSHNNNHEKQIYGLLKRMMWPNKFKYPIAKLYIKEKLVKAWLQGMEIKEDLNQNTKWFGTGISAFKLKIILSDFSKVGPFYSNSFLEEKPQFNLLIEQYLKYKYERKFLSALIMDIREGNDEIFAEIKPIKSGFFKIKFVDETKKL
jgi:hypothetical protein